MHLMKEHSFRRFEFSVGTITRNPESASFDRNLQIIAPHAAEFDLNNKFARGGNEDVGIGNPKRLITGSGTRHWKHSEFWGLTPQTVIRAALRVKLW